MEGGAVSTVYRQLGDNFALVVKADRRPPLIADAIDVAAVAEKAKESDA
jgi:hypothetical protein